MVNYFIPTQGPESWKAFLADPIKQWKKGYSAYELAHCWEVANNLPCCVDKVFKHSEFTLFHNVEVLFGFPEYKVPLPGGNSRSQNDLYVLAKADNELLPIMVEGKVSEPFGETVEIWLSKNPSEGKRKRLEFLLNLLGLHEDCVHNIRYQLLHRAASAVLEARNLNTHHSLMLVHSFSETGKWYEDYANFVRLFHLSPKRDGIVGPVELNEVNLYFGWVTGEKTETHDFPEENYKINNQKEKSAQRIELWSNKRLQFEPKGWMKQMKEDLRTNLKGITPIENGVLYCKFCTKEDHAVFDVENVLLYNVGSGSFSGISNNQVFMERTFEPSPFVDRSINLKHYHLYNYTTKDNISFYWKKDGTIFEWSGLQVSSLKYKPHEYWYNMKKLQTKKKYNSLIKDTNFGIRINIGIPVAKSVNLTAICKPLLDGVISAFHNYSGSDLDEMAMRLASILSIGKTEVANLLRDDQMAILGLKEVVRRFQRGVQWNPSDDSCYQIQLTTYKCNGPNWIIDGEVYLLRK
ncbi:hypothetical protein ABE288_03475 [Bacillus salipaludis]|uniref:DUF6946 family protein n=1 Tax=Bacillus salipaludis TaxID=2547811 RepID=UPI003D19AEB9